MPKRKTREDFIKEAIELYGDKYDYSKVDYINSSTKVEILCSKHGPFFKSPEKFLKAKQECLSCKGRLKWTWERFIKEANEFHSNKFKYPKQKYINKTHKYIIICPIHGEFKQSIAHHLKGGCNKCAIELRNKNQRDTKDDFIKKSNLLFGDKYDYSEVDYFNSQTKVIIGCPIHGKFKMKPNSHLNGQNCPKCGRINANRNIRTPWDITIERFRSVHGNKYEYLENTYKDFTTEMSMICNQHGEFKTTPHAHYSMKSGCRTCGINNRAEKNSHKFEQVLNEFRNVHGNSYKYDEKSYKGVDEKIRIKCDKHGWFRQRVASHKNGSGCLECSYELIGDRTRVTYKIWKKQSAEVHGDLYDYSKVKWIDQYTDVLIGCKKPDHGFFYQEPVSHKRGSGCPKCNHSSGERFIFNWLNKMEIDFFTQHTFPDLKYKSQLKCDFFIPDYNLVIEYNGRQHYVAVDFFDGVKGLRATQKRDKIKRDYCFENGINYEIIKYDENIEDELKKIFN
jgi:hypothetical protein